MSHQVIAARGLIELAAGPASATISPEEGGMLLSLRVGGRELLVQRRAGAEPVPMFGSFLMAPWVGELADGRFEFRGRTVGVPPNRGRHAIHGLVATVPWVIEAASPTVATLTCQLVDPWPFGGTVEQRFHLDADGLTLEAEIRATDRAMPAALGWHPWFAAPDPHRVRVGVNAPSMLELDDELIPTGAIGPATGDWDLRAAPVLGDRRIDTVFVGAASPARLHVPGVDLELNFDPAIDTVVVFSSPGAVCVEPWSAWPNAFNLSTIRRSGFSALEPGDALHRWTRWAWVPS